MAQGTELAGHVLGGKYRLVRTVSDGPRKVYEARHERLAGRFAVKQWPATTPWDAFRAGAELAMTLRHPGVMQVLDFNCEPGSAPFLVLEWVDGARLSEVIAGNGIMPIERVAPLVESAAWALASAHQQGVVHQELRPGEVFVVHAPGTMREWVKLAGFGVSAALARRDASPAYSRYRAPEQKAGGSPDDGDDPQTDQYALAAMAYEMLAGVPPVQEEGSRAEPLPIAELAPGVSPAVDTAIRQALATEPEQRFAGVLEFARALRDAVDGASPESLRRRSAASASPDRRARGAEAVSPFFNPLQGRASEVFRRVASTTARLKALAGPPAQRGPATRIALSGAALLLAVAGPTIAMRHAPPPAAPKPATSSAPPVVIVAPAPVASAPVVPAPTPLQTPPPPARTTADAEEAAPDDDGDSAKRARAAAWAKLRATTAHPAPSPAPKVKAPAARPAARVASATPKARAGTPTTAAAPKPPPKMAAAPPKPAAPPKVAAAPPKPAAPLKPAPPPPAAAASACVLSVGSRPPADIWLDDHSLGRRTPLIKYRTACGDHKLALKRTDLDLYQMEIVTLRAGAPFKKVYPLQ